MEFGDLIKTFCLDDWSQRYFSVKSGRVLLHFCFRVVHQLQAATWIVGESAVSRDFEELRLRARKCSTLQVGGKKKHWACQTPKSCQLPKSLSDKIDVVLADWFIQGKRKWKCCRFCALSVFCSSNVLNWSESFWFLSRALGWQTDRFCRHDKLWKS